MAGPLFDATSNTSGTGNLSWTHTPVGTPKGIVVQIVQNAGTTDEVTAVTYGAVAMTRVVGGTVFHTAGAEDGAVYTYFLGSGIPTGAQTVAVTVDGTGSEKVAVASTVTAATSDTVVDDSATLDSSGVANPSVTLSTTTDCFIVAALHSGLGSTTNLAPGADYTELFEDDLSANQICGFERRTTNPALGSITVDWIAASDEAGIGAVAIREAAAGNSATVAVTFGGFKSTTFAEFDPPVFSATATALFGGFESAIVAHSLNYAATCAIEFGGFQSAAVADYNTEVFTGAVVVGFGGFQSSAVAVSGATFTANVTATFGGLRSVANAHGSIYIASSTTVVFGGFESASAATFTPADFNAAAVVTFGGFESAAVATFEAPDFTAAVALTFGGFQVEVAALSKCAMEKPAYSRAYHRRRTSTVTHLRRTSKATMTKDTC